MRKRRGFSLIEVLMATFVALTCALIVVATMPTAVGSRTKGDNTMKAMGLAQKEMESVKSVGYPNLTANDLYTKGLIDTVTPVATSTYSFTSVDNGVADSPAAILPSGAGRVAITQVDTELRQITVTVSWVERGRARSVTLGTYVANL